MLRRTLSRVCQLGQQLRLKRRLRLALSGRRLPEFNKRMDLLFAQQFGTLHRFLHSFEPLVNLLIARGTLLTML